MLFEWSGVLNLFICVFPGLVSSRSSSYFNLVVWMIRCFRKAHPSGIFRCIFGRGWIKVTSEGLVACEGTWWYRMGAFFPELPQNHSHWIFPPALNQFILPTHGITHIARLIKNRLLLYFHSNKHWEAISFSFSFLLHGKSLTFLFWHPM